MFLPAQARVPFWNCAESCFWGCLIFAIFIFAIQEKIADVEKFLIKSNLKETHLYEKPVVHGNKIDRVKEFVDAGVVGCFCLRFGANGRI